METNFRNTNIENMQYTTVAGENKLLRASFSWMSLAMVLTAVTAYVFANNLSLISLLVSSTGGLSVLGYVIMFAPILFVIALGAGFRRFSLPVLITLFVTYAIINGISFSFIFLVYELGSIANVFFSTAALFGIMALAGYTTKTDLTKLGSILMIGLIAIVVTSLITMLIGGQENSTLTYVINILGVIIFTGLTAYDVQKIKNMGQEVQGGELAAKLGIMGALTLYLDFINLFLFLLRLFGRKD